MNASEIKKLVTKFRREYGIRDVTSEALEGAFEKQGFTIIEFNPVVNDPDVNTVVDTLHLREMILHAHGFLYADSNYRLVFLNEKLNTEERCIVLAHEEGHYCCGHVNSGNVIGRSVIEEQEANEFSHYLLRKTLKSRLVRGFSNHKKPLIIGMVIAGIVAGVGAVSKEMHEGAVYEGDYYVTRHGEKYHLKDCVTIQGHEIRRLTKEDVAAGTYEPCSVCHPDG